jgi:aspartate carbamoyltransferase catalytic subunit
MNRKDVLDLDDFTADEIEQVLDTAEAMREVMSRPIRRVPPLRGKTIVNLFYEPSTRTRISFELAAKNLSADVVNVSASGSSVEKGESLIDTVRTLQALGADVVVMRHQLAGAPYLVAQHLRGSVVNAGDGWHAHPTQALLDAFTIRQKLGQIEGLQVLIVGDILHSRVARSNVWCLSHLGARVTLCGPPTLMPDFGTNGHRAGLPAVEVCYDLDKCVARADVIMALRIQKERQDAGLVPSLREYARLYQVNEKRVERARSGVLVMHPGPMNEGVEIASEVARGAQSVIEDQVTNGVAIRMALLYLLAGERVGEAVA